MKKLLIEGTISTPTIILDPDNNKFEISGSSRPEGIELFYKPILFWIDDYIKKPNLKTVFDFKLDYFNSASLNMILKILARFESLKDNGHEVTVRWYYEDDDDDLREAGTDFAQLTSVPIELIAF